MEKKLDYSFDDEVANKSCYDIYNKKITICFEGYYTRKDGLYVDRSCIWIIENWIDAKSKLNSQTSYSDLGRHLGVVSMVLSAEMNETTLELTVNTVDNRYVDLRFDNPQLKLIEQ